LINTAKEGTMIWFPKTSLFPDTVRDGNQIRRFGWSHVWTFFVTGEFLAR
jgi:hypothetical protein